VTGNACFAPLCGAEAEFTIGHIQTGAELLACWGHVRLALSRVDPDDQGRLAAEVARLRQGLAIIPADYPEAREAATEALWPIEGGAA
jgi:hypothetical protein